jgi:CRISPR-associated endonuclease Csn1
MKKRILGIDTGTNSLGWAVVDRDDKGTYSLVKKGVLLFQEGVKVEKGIESSKAAERTAHRALRRQYFRRRLRKIEALKALIKYNLCPALSEEDLKLWHTRKIYPLKDEFMLWQRTDEKTDKNPYHDRYICLTEKLDFNKEADRFTFGRAIYHLAQRRGFKSNRLEESDDKESGAVKAGIADLTKEMQAAGCQYLGEFFYKLYKEQGNGVRIRTRYIDREEQYVNEFKAICAKQGISDEMQHELYRALYFQRPLKSQRQGVGKCTQEKDKPRCPISHPLFEEFRKLGFINNVRVKGPYDTEFRPLSESELQKIEPLFYRKSKPDFDFEDIAKAIAGKKNYRSKNDPGNEQYVFNYRMSQNVSGCPTTAQLRSIFGEDWQTAIAETYAHSTKKDGTAKTVDEIVNDIWNVLFFFDSNEKLKEFAQKQLQLNEEEAKKFAEIKLKRDYASLSIKAIRNILPFLRMGLIVPHATFMANIPNIVGPQVWNDEAKREHILNEVQRILSTPRDEIKNMEGTFEFCIKQLLMQDYGVTDEAAEKLYHPSIIETYPDARPNKDGVILLGSPMTNAVRNPMAMRSLHEVRKVINKLILEGVVSPSTEVHIEYARELNDANKRKAINDVQRAREKERAKYKEEIKQLYKKQTGKDIEPTDTDVLKYQLWIEQEGVCLYTGKTFEVCDFIGPKPKYDIEHTIPRSVGGDSTMENMTLCELNFNRYTKKAKMPSQLDNYEEILERIEPWKERYEALTKDVDRLKKGRSADKNSNDNRIQKKHRLQIERDYWRGKYQRFTMTEVPEGFARRQGAGIGLISKYAGLFLKTYFHDAQNPDKRQIFTVKGTTTMECRKMWGLQEEYEKKSRDNHAHHCVDAIVIACIGKRQYDLMAQWYKAEEEFRRGERRDIPQFEKPWPTFTEDVKALYDELLIVHDTKDNTLKAAKKRVKTLSGKHLATGDSVRGSLHMDTYYGAIERDGEVRHVKRIALENLEAKDIKNIVDDAVRSAVQEAADRLGLKEAVKEGIFLGGKTPIKKVRCFANDVKTPIDIRMQRDKGPKDYKHSYHVKNDGNYCIGIYEGTVNGKVKRDFEVVNVLDAAKRAKKHEDILPAEKNGMSLIYNLKIGQHVLLLDKEESRKVTLTSPLARLYVITGLTNDVVSRRVVIKIIHSQEARQVKDLTPKMGAYVIGEDKRPFILLTHNSFHALVEGQDFILSPLGDITYINHK